MPACGAPVPVVETARRLAGWYRPERVPYPIDCTGIRPGERLHEVLLSPNETFVEGPAPGLRAVRTVRPASRLDDLPAVIADLRQRIEAGDRVGLTRACLAAARRPSQRESDALVGAGVRRRRREHLWADHSGRALRAAARRARHPPRGRSPADQRAPHGRVRDARRPVGRAAGGLSPAGSLSDRPGSGHRMEPRGRPARARPRRSASSSARCASCRSRCWTTDGGSAPSLSSSAS
jgi:hypothetical protein